jgi:hypothetical protein
MALTLNDIFALDLETDPSDVRCKLAAAVCDRHYWIYGDAVGNEVRIRTYENCPANIEPLPIWTRDLDQSVVEWCNVNPAELGFDVGVWREEAFGWARTRPRDAND